MRWLWLVMLAGCYRPNEYATTCNLACDEGACPSGLICNLDGFCRSDPDECLTMPDATVVNNPDTPLSPTAVCGAYLDVCVDPPPTKDRTISTGITINTTLGMPAPCDQTQVVNGVDLCILFAKNITITDDGSVRGIGTRPLV